MLRQLLPRKVRLAYRRTIAKRRAKFKEPLHSAPSLLSAVIAYNELGGYVIPNESIHRWAPQRILSGAVWEKSTIEYMIAQAGQGDIVHAGTYFGDFLPALSAGIALEAKVWAFEPNRVNFRCASMTVLLNGLTNVELRNAALGAEDGMLTMITRDISGHSLGGGSEIVAGISGNIDLNHTEMVSQVVLDRVIPVDRKISILQLDVENFEQQALSGALQLVKRCKPLLILETVPEKNWFSEHIESLGYMLSTKIGDNSVFSVQ